VGGKRRKQTEAWQVRKGSERQRRWGKIAEVVVEGSEAGEGKELEPEGS